MTFDLLLHVINAKHILISAMTEFDELLKEVAVAKTTAMFQNLALVGALAERRLVDPAKVADWAEFFAKGMENSGNDSAAPAHLRTAAGLLRDYAKQLMSTVKPPDNPE
jgi:hypothetical protein